MQNCSVNVGCDVTAKVYNQPFRYRVYVNDELFAERAWIWEGIYLEEMLPISAPPGVYLIKFEVVDPDHGRIKVRNWKVTGPGQIFDYYGDTALKINASK